MVIFLLLACGEGEVVVDDTDPQPSPYIYDDGEEAEPSLSEADISGAIDEIIGELMLLNAAPILDSYVAATGGQQEDCPDMFESDGSVYWYDYCYADDGSYFAGYGFYYEYEDYETDESYIYNGSQLFTESEVTNAEGHVFSGGGSASDLRADYVGIESVEHTVFYSVIGGGFSFDGPEADESWMSEGLSPALTTYGYWIPEVNGYTGNLLYVTGGVSGLVGTANAVALEDFSMFPVSLGSSCETEPHGTISVRSTDGLWYDVVFDGPEAWSGDVVDAADCDGCGTIYFRGEAMGEACSTFDGLLDWGEQPW